ncbi:two component transcriptional regulator, LytTR family [Cyclobacterium lianum]|uniref:Two component transcriptional regulator, LytTR family n=1 Tax=Cyclobacterium lianum TaxID=388280 RepID=A0A1M7Q7W6_9BACT|nr:LytTR family DNA-binding domain-containing protein [Cyclobacterium lianum]SHN26698.1 two component transcriptional regulator, LytTR family [Cyclobacterium lianum]
MLKAIIIDDEDHCRSRLVTLLDVYAGGQVKVLGSYANTDNLDRVLKGELPDVVFMDIELDDQLIFTWLGSRADWPFELVFTTAHEKYAIEAIKANAVDYLLKPIDPDELLLSLERIRAKRAKEPFGGTRNNDGPDLLYGPKKRIPIPTQEGLNFVDPDEISHLQADVNYTVIHFQNKQKVTVAKTLKEFELMLHSLGFFRVHNSHLVNLSKVRQFRKGKGGTLVLDNGSQIEVSTRKKEALLKALRAP